MNATEWSDSVSLYRSNGRDFMDSWMIQKFSSKNHEVGHNFYGMFAVFHGFGDVKPIQLLFQGFIAPEVLKHGRGWLGEKFGWEVDAPPLQKKGLVSNVDKPLKRLDGVVFLNGG